MSDKASTSAKLSRALLTVLVRSLARTLVSVTTFGCWVTGKYGSHYRKRLHFLIIFDLCSFMKNVYNVFDFDKNAVGFAALKNPPA